MREKARTRPRGRSAHPRVGFACSQRRAGSPTQATTRPATILVAAVLVPREPRDRADRPRDEEKPVGEPARSARRAAAPSSVSSAIPERLSFASDGWQTCVVSRTSSSRSPGSDALAVRQRPGLERAVDDDLVLAVLERVELRLREAEAPGPRVVRGAVRDPVRRAPGCVCRCGRSSVERHRRRARARCSSRRGDSTRGSRRRAAPSAARCTRRGCSTRPAPSSRGPACRSAPRGARAGCGAPTARERLAHAVARDAATDREELAS